MKADSSTIFKFVILALCLLFIIFVVWKLYRDNMALRGDDDAIYWPPEINKCPDYWTFKEGECHNGAGSKVTDPLTGNVTKEQLHEKCLRMKDEKIPWEGIDNLCV